VKPLSKQLKDVSVFAGATIMGDGGVALILDVLSIAQKAGVVRAVRERAAHEEAVPGFESGASGNSSTALLFSLGASGRMAVPLSDLARLEEFAPDEFEWTGDEEVVQYREEIMRVIRLKEILPERRSVQRGVADVENDDRIPVIVYSLPEGSVGLVVDQIIDIVEECLDVQRPPTRSGVLGSVVVDGRVTEILDLEAIVEMAGIKTASGDPVLEGVG
jgi:two-component system chemotaxis sensor kinase CheA